MKARPVETPSLVALCVQSVALGNDLGSATGFIANSAAGPMLITNWHVVSGRHPETGRPIHPSLAVPDHLRVFHHEGYSDGFTRWGWRTEPLYDADNNPLWVEHPRRRQAVDVVALRLTQTAGVELTTCDIHDRGDGDRLRPATRVSVVGFPFGIRSEGGLGIWTTGFVASEPELASEDWPVFLIDCRTRAGQSGSPVFAQNLRGVSEIYLGEGG